MDKDFYKTEGSTCSLEIEKDGKEFCGLDIRLSNLIKFKPLEIKKGINCPPYNSFLREKQMQGFAIGGYHRSGLYTERKSWTVGINRVLRKYFDGFKYKGYW